MQARDFYNDRRHPDIIQTARKHYMVPHLRRLLIDHTRLSKTFSRSPVTEDMTKAVLQHD